MTIKVKDQEILLYKRRRYARLALTRAIKQGKVKKGDCCELCKSDKEIQAHHTDYGSPLHVTWLCRVCHGHVHRDDHPLNPDNVEQTVMPHLDEEDMVNVTFYLPVKHFLALSKIAEMENLPISQLIKKEMIQKYPVQSKQMDLFNDYDNTRETQHTRVQSLGQDERSMQQPEASILPVLWSERNINPRGLGEKFLNFPLGNGRHASRLQRAG